MKSLLHTLLPMLLILSFLSGCQTKTKIKYIKTPCPKLVFFYRDKNSSLWDQELKLSVPSVDDNLTKSLLENDDVKYNFLKSGVWGFVKLKKLKDVSYFVQDLKKRGRDDSEVLLLYEEMIWDYNKKRD